VIALCDHCDVLITAYLHGLGVLKQRPIGRYESEIEFYTLLKLMLRHLESITVLARNDLVLAPSAHLIARTIFETSIRARWMFIPIDPFEREVRWILFLRSGTSQAKKLAESKYTSDVLVRTYHARRTNYAYFDSELCQLLTEKGYVIPTQAPNMREMLKELDEPHLYKFYVLLSAYSHSNFEAASLYKRGLGTTKTTGEFTSGYDWVLPFSVAWKSFYLAARDFLDLIDAQVDVFEDVADAEKYDAKIEALIKTELGG
jgi:hypothetical protein